MLEQKWFGQKYSGHSSRQISWTIKMKHHVSMCNLASWPVAFLFTIFISSTANEAIERKNDVIFCKKKKIKFPSNCAIIAQLALSFLYKSDNFYYIEVWNSDKILCSIFYCLLISKNPFGSLEGLISRLPMHNKLSSNSNQP